MKNKEYRFYAVYLIVVIAIIMLTVINLSGKGYKVIQTPEMVDEQIADDMGNFHETHSTDKITLTKGNYQFIISYATTTRAKIEACVQRDAIAEGVLEENPKCGFYSMDVEVEKSTSEFYFKITDSENLQVHDYEIVKKNGHIVYDEIYYAILFLLFAGYVLFVLINYKSGKYDTGKLVTIFSLMAITAFVSSPVFNEYLIYGFDIQFHLSRIEGMKDALLDGQLIPTIYPNCNNGYGVLGIMYPGFFLMPSAILRLCDVSMVASYHFFVLLVNILTVTVAWIASRSFTKSNVISIICVLLCACNPLRMTSLYQSAAVGATLGMVFMPLVFAGLFEVIYGDKKKWYYITISYTCILMSHVLSCIIVAIISFVIILFSCKELFDKKEKRYISLIVSISVFLIINSWYIVLFIMYYRYSLNNSFIFSTHYYKDTIIPTKLFMMSTTNMVSPQAEKGILDGCNQSMGIAGLICLFAMIIDAIIPDSDSKRKKWNIICLLIGTGFIYIGTSLFPWYKTTQIDILNNFMGTVQFPHRFYSETAPILFILGAVSVERLANRQEAFFKNNAANFRILTAVMCIFSIIGCYTIMDTFNVQIPFKNLYSGGYASYPLIEYLPQNTDTSMFSTTETHSFGAKVINYCQDGTSAELICKSYDEGAYVLLPLLYYPGYEAVGDGGKNYRINKCSDGRIQVFLPVTEEEQEIYIFRPR